MKSTVVLCLMLCLGFAVQAQNVSATTEPAMIGEAPTTWEEPLMVLNLLDTNIEFSEEALGAEDFANTQIQLGWINSVSFVDEQEAVLAYGEQARNGVILIELKDEALASLPPALLKAFGEQRRKGS